MICMAVYFIAGNMRMNDDGFHYEGFAESLAHGKLDFKSFYGFQGLSFFAVPVFWLIGSHNSIIITSAIFSLLSVPLAYFIGKEFYPAPSLSADRHKGAGLVRDSAPTAGIYFMILILLMPYPYTTMMRGFQEAAVLFFVLLVIYASIHKKLWSPVAWAVGGVVKPFVLVLFPLFIKDFLNSKKIAWLVFGLLIGGMYLGASYYQTGHLVNNAAINSYQGNFDPGNPPPLVESFAPGVKGFLRIGANLLLHFRKIMISPFVIVLGALALLRDRHLRLRKEIILAITLNLLLVGSLSFSFPKYLLPMTTLFALASVGYLVRYKWLMPLVLLDSVFVFLPIWNYFGHVYWSNVYLYMIPLWMSIALFTYERLQQKHSYNPNS